MRGSLGRVATHGVQTSHGEAVLRAKDCGQD